MNRLIIGNRCYSSWSLRPWLLMKTLDIPFEEELIRLDQPDTATRVRTFSPAGLVPVLIDDETTVWDSLAIMERLAETSGKRVWPEDPTARATARSLAAEMHAGFADLRREYPMNLGKRFAHRERPSADHDVARVLRLIEDARGRFGHDGDFLFGAFTATDAMYAPVMARFGTYSVPLDGVVAAYKEAVVALPAYREWKEKALQEPWVRPGEELDEEPVEDLREGITAGT